MPKLLKYIIIIALILIAIFAILKFTNKEKGEEITNNQETSKKVFEDPEYMIYIVNDKEKYRLTKKDKEYAEVLEKLNSSLVEGFTSKETAFREKGYGVGLDIIDIHKEIYSKNAVLRLIYSDNYEIDIVFEKNSVLDIIYIENNKKDCFYGFDNKVQEEIKEYLDNK
ncbi:unknown [Clostridium sp. CAG:452]|jgi:hypothetical protein|nr:unknown [Clostridium sp. CAG:452]